MSLKNICMALGAGYTRAGMDVLQRPALTMTNQAAFHIRRYRVNDGKHAVHVVVYHRYSIFSHRSSEPGASLGPL